MTGLTSAIADAVVELSMHYEPHELSDSEARDVVEIVIKALGIDQIGWTPTYWEMRALAAEKEMTQGRQRIAELEAQLAAKDAEIARLEALALVYGRHTDRCSTHGGHDCDCGWEAQKAALKEPK